MLRYDTQGTDWWVVDIVFLNASKFVGSDSPSMPALILEGDRVDYPALYNIYLVDLALGDNDDVSDCWSIGNNCSNTTAIEKYDVFNFSCKLPPSVESSVEFINFEAIAVYDDPDNDDDCHETLIAVNDNGGGVTPNVFITYDMDYCQTDEDKSCATEYPSFKPTSMPSGEPTLPTLWPTQLPTVPTSMPIEETDSDSVQSIKTLSNTAVLVSMVSLMLLSWWYL